MTIEIHSITIKATVVDGDKSRDYYAEFKPETPNLPGLIGDIFRLAKLYVFHNSERTVAQ